jgi:gluconate 5-dehydrogenase
MKDYRKIFDLTGRVAVVTGGTGGFGHEVAVGMAQFGADVVVTARTIESLKTVAEEIRQTGRKGLALSCDVSDPASVRAMMKKTLDEFGKVDILVTAAGIALREPAEDFNIENWQRVMDVNVKGTLLCCQAAAKDMIARGKGGKIITVSSIRGLLGHPAGYSAYGTSKGAVHLLTRQLACEWSKYKINVNSIAPCIFWTPLTKPILENKELYNIFMQRIPWGRAGEPGDFVGATVYLASDASDLVTGHIMYVDGGANAG